MAPSRSLRRLAAALVALACVLTPRAASADGASRDRRGAGEAGSGMPALPLAKVADTNGIVWSDVPDPYWARRAIDDVAATHRWMRDFPANDDGTYPFQPLQIESRRSFARAIVRAFAPKEPTDPQIAFPDLPDTDPFFRFANVAVKLGWMRTGAGGDFAPAGPVTTRSVHRALVLAVGLRDLAAGANAIHLRNGTKVPVPNGFGTLLIGMLIGLRYNHVDESLDVGPNTPLPRAEVAWSLYRATTMPSWMPEQLAPYADMRLPNLGPRRLAIVEWGVRYVGYPYVWGGEWDTATGAGYCCGQQPVGGFDCSGLTWWVMKSATDTWDNAPPRPYLGWSLLQRTSTDMAANGKRVKWNDLRPGDLMFYDGDGDGRVDHVDTYIGRGWAIDSSSTPAGVTIMWVGTGWYADHFVHGRRLLSASTS